MTASTTYHVTPEQAAGNWREFTSFAWFGRDDVPDPENWTIHYIVNRDSPLLDRSNAAAIRRAMARFMGKTCREERHTHWACGWADALVVRVYVRGTKRVTKAFATLCDLRERMNDYPVLDDEDYSRLEYEATLENIKLAAHGMVADDAKDGWEGDVYSWFSDHDDAQIQNADDQGGCPSEAAMLTCLASLGLLDQEHQQPAAVTPAGATVRKL